MDKKHQAIMSLFLILIFITIIIIITKHLSKLLKHFRACILHDKLLDLVLATVHDIVHGLCCDLIDSIGASLNKVGNKNSDVASHYFFLLSGFSFPHWYIDHRLVQETP